MQQLSDAQQKALTLVPELSALIGEDIPSPAKIATCQKLIRERLVIHGNEEEKLVGCMLCAFLERRCYAGFAQKFDSYARQFIEARYRFAENTHSSADESGVIAYNGEGLIDSTNMAHIVTDTLSQRGAYQNLAGAAGKWMAYFIHQAQENYPDCFDMLQAVPRELNSANIQPFSDISITEFGGREDNVLSRSGVNQLLYTYRVIAESKATIGEPNVIDPQDPNFISLETPGILKDKLTTRYVVANNVFAKGAVKYESRKHTANLLCTIANAMADGAKLYVSNNLGDAYDFANDKSVLALAGFTALEEPRWHKKHPAREDVGQYTYALQRDHTVRKDPVTPREFTTAWRLLSMSPDTRENTLH